MNEMDVFAVIHQEIDDEGLSLLRSRFYDGGGRRKQISSSTTATNRQLLQINFLRESNKKSWEDVEKWMKTLYPNFPSNKSRHLVERTTLAVLKCATDERQQFYEQENDLDEIGPYTKMIGLNRTSVKDPTTLSAAPLTRGAVLELFNELRLEHTMLIMDSMYPDKFNKADLKKRINNWEGRLKRLQAKRKRNEMNAYRDQILEECSQVSLTKCEPSHKQSHVPPSSQPEVKLQAPEKQTNFKRDIKVNDLENKVESLKEQLGILQEAYKEKCVTIDSLSEETNALRRNVNAVSSDLHLTQGKLNECNAKLRVAKAELQGLKGSPEYKSLKRSLRYERDKSKRFVDERHSQANECKLKEDKAEVEISKLKSQVVALQKKASEQKNVLNRYKEGEKQLNGQLKSLKQEIADVTVKSLILAGDDLITKSDKKGEPYTEDIEICLMEMVGENGVSASSAGLSMGSMAKWVFGKDITNIDFPKATVATTMMDRAHVLAKIQVMEALKDSERWNLHSDGTTRDHNKILGHQVVTDKGESLSVGFCPLSVENSTTLLDNAIAMIDELADVCPEDEKEIAYKKLITSMFAVMSDRAAVNKAFNTQMSDYRKNFLGDDVDLQYLYCNAHFLLGLSSECEKKLRSIESDLAEPLGRDASAQFARFSSSHESSVARFIRTACDVLGPRGDEKNGCKIEWESYCEEIHTKSYVTSFRMNRFNNFFEGAAGLYLHRKAICDFLDTYKEKLNLKLESVLLDAKSQQLQAFVRAVGLLFFMVTGPFWAMLNSDLEYVDLHIYVQRMYTFFQQCANDSSDLLEQHPGMFPDFSISSGEVYQSLLFDQGEAFNASTRKALEEIFKAFIDVAERQLNDFLPGGKYSAEVSDEIRSAMKHCKLTNLLSEHEFGDLDYSQYRRRHASLHHHSSIQMVKKNKTISVWLSSKTKEERSAYLKTAREKASELRKKHRIAEKQVKEDTMKRLESVARRKMEKKAKIDDAKMKLVNRVKEHGGPCKCSHAVDKLLGDIMESTATVKLEVVKDEIRYLKTILDIKDKRLLFSKKGIDELIECLRSVLGMTQCNGKCDAMTAENEPPSKKQRIEKESLEVAPSKDMWVAVAYEEDYFIGIVKEIDGSNATIQFLKRGPKDSFAWPRVDDIADVELEYIFASDIEVIAGQGRRPKFDIPQLEYILELYETFKKVNFIPI